MTTETNQVTNIDGQQFSPVVVTPALNFPTLAAVEAGTGFTTGQCLGFVVDQLALDPGYAWSWHCALAMSYRDSGGDILIAQKASAQFLSILSQNKIDMTKNENYIDWMKRYDAEHAVITAGMEAVTGTGALVIEDGATADAAPDSN